LPLHIAGLASQCKPTGQPGSPANPCSGCPSAQVAKFFAKNQATFRGTNQQNTRTWRAHNKQVASTSLGIGNGHNGSGVKLLPLRPLLLSPARNISRLSTFRLLGFSTFSSVTGYTEICAGRQAAEGGGQKREEVRGRRECKAVSPELLPVATLAPHALFRESTLPPPSISSPASVNLLTFFLLSGP